MKFQRSKICMFGALLCALPYAGAEPLDRDAVMTQKIVAPLDTASMDDYLIGMARAANVNIIADATDFPDASPVAAYPATSGAIAGTKGPYQDKWNPIFLNLLGDYAAQKELSVLRPSARVLLLWSEPVPRELLDLQLNASEDADAELVKQAIAADEAAGGQSVLDGEPLANAKLNKMLRQYLEYQFGWTGKVAERTAAVDLTVAFADLPPTLRALVVPELRRQLVSSLQNPALQGSPIDESDARIYAVTRDDMTQIEVRKETQNEENQSRSVTTYPLYSWKGAAPPIEPAERARPTEPQVKP